MGYYFVFTIFKKFLTKITQRKQLNMDHLAFFAEVSKSTWCNHTIALTQLQLGRIPISFYQLTSHCIPTWFHYRGKQLSRDGSRRRGGGNDTPPPVELTLSRSQKVTVRRECGSRRCSYLSDLGSPDIGRGKKNEAKWLAGGPKRKWGSLPLSGSKYKKKFFWATLVADGR